MNFIDRMIEMKARKGWDYIDLSFAIMIVLVIALAIVPMKCTVSVNIKSTPTQGEVHG